MSRFHVPRDLPSYLIAFITMALLVFVAYSVGALVREQSEIVQSQREAAERAEERTINLRGDIEQAVISIQEELLPHRARTEGPDIDERLTEIIDTLSRIEESVGQNE